jgi:hypothetical protein
MDRFIAFKLTIAAAAAAIPISAAAQTSPPAPPPQILAPAALEKDSAKATRPPSRRPRAISSEAAAALAAAAPKYTPPPPQPPPKPVEEQPDLREIDKPRNEIVRLPDFVVREKKPTVFSERTISTDKGLRDIAMRRYISDVDRALNLVSLPFFGALAEERALAMYIEDERLRNMSELRDAAENASKVDSAAGAYIRRESDMTYLRSRDFGWSSTK